MLCISILKGSTQKLRNIALQHAKCGCNYRMAFIEEALQSGIIVLVQEI